MCLPPYLGFLDFKLNGRNILGWICCHGQLGGVSVWLSDLGTVEDSCLGSVHSLTLPCVSAAALPPSHILLLKQTCLQNCLVAPAPPPL